MKKILSFILVLVLALSAVSFPAFADDNSIGKMKVGNYTMEITSDTTCTITEYSGKESVAEIPESIEGYTVTAIGDYAFSKNYHLMGVRIPATVKVIGEGAFFYCYNMSTVTIPDTVESIGEKAFGFNRRKFDTDTCTYTYRADPTFTVYAKKNSVGENFAIANNFELNENEMFNDFANSLTFQIPYQWTDFTNIYCHIWDMETGETYTNWQSNKEKCEIYYDSVEYNADTNIGISLSYDTVYGVIFSTDTGEQTYPAIYYFPLTHGTLCTGDTYVSSIEDEGSASRLQAKWWNGREYADLSAYENAFGLYKNVIFSSQDEATKDETTYDEALSWGDANCDGKVNIKDATAIQKHVANLVLLSDEGRILSNFINKDTPLTVRNATAVQKHCAGLQTYADIGKPAVTQVPVERPHSWYRQEMYALSWSSDPDNVMVLPDKSIYKENDQHAVFLVPIYNNNISITCNGETTQTWTMDFYSKDQNGYSDYVLEVYNDPDGSYKFIWTSWD